MTLDETIRAACSISRTQLLEINLLSNSVHMLFVVYVDGRAKFICKYPREFSAEVRITNEARCLKHARKVMEGLDTVLLPNLVAEVDLHGRKALITSFESGQNGRQEADNPKTRAAIVSWLAEFGGRSASSPGTIVTVMQQIESRAAEIFGEENLRSWRLGWVDSAGLDQLPRVMTHGDLSYNNVLRSDDDCLAVIDWEDGDPEGLPLLDAIDFLLYSDFAHSGDYRIAASRLFQEGDRDAQGLLGAYCKALKIPVQAIGPLARAALLQILLRISSRESLRGMESPRARSKVMQLIEVINTTDFDAIRWGAL